MGVLYYLNDPAKGECFEFGKGWSPDEGPAWDHAPRGPGYAWVPLNSETETGAYVRHAFGWANTNDADGWPQDYFDHMAHALWTWLQGRDQTQLDVNHDCGDDLHCHREEHDDLCSPYPGSRHFYVTGHRYRRDP